MPWELPLWMKETPQWFIDLGPGRPGTEAARGKSTWPQIRILGLEPCSERFESCLPTFPGQLLRCAAWEEDTSNLPFFASPKDKLWGLFAPDDLPLTERVAGRCLDSLDGEWGPFDRVVIWADIEGSELKMLRGATQLLKSGRVMALNLEVRPVPYAKGWCVESEVDAFLQAFGFCRARQYQEHGRGHHYDVIYIPSS